MGPEEAKAKTAAWVQNRRKVYEALLQVPHKVTSTLVPYRYNPALEYLEPRLTGRDFVLKSRQLYITTFFQLSDLYTVMMTPNYNSILLIDNEDEAKLYHDKYLFFYEQFPEGVEVVPGYPVAFRPKLLTDNVSLLEFDHEEGHSYLRIASIRKNIVGRGITVNNVHGPEFSIWNPDFARQAMTAVEGASTPRTTVKLETSAKEGESGAASAGLGYAHDLWLECKNRTASYNPIFLPWWLDDTAKILPNLDVPNLDVADRVSPLTHLTERELILIRDHGLSEDQLRYKRWAYKKLKELAPQECAEDDITCWIQHGRTVFDLGIIDEYLGRCLSPISSTNELELFQHPRPTGLYSMGVDVMEGLGGNDQDYHSIVIVDGKSLRTCAIFYSQCSIPELVAKIKELGLWYNNALAVVERNSYGAAVIQYLEQEGYPNIYSEGDKPGWHTNLATKPRMVESLKRLIVDRSFQCESRSFWEDMRNYLRLPNGRMGAVGKAHDDRPMATMLAIIGIEEGLSQYEDKAIVLNGRL